MGKYIQLQWLGLIQISGTSHTPKFPRTDGWEANMVRQGTNTLTATDALSLQSSEHRGLDRCLSGLEAIRIGSYTHTGVAHTRAEVAARRSAVLLEPHQISRVGLGKHRALRNYLRSAWLTTAIASTTMQACTSKRPSTNVMQEI